MDADRGAADRSRDARLGVSLIIPVRPEARAYRDIVDSLARVEPDQYYYPYGDLHITIFDFLQARSGYARDAELEGRFLEISRTVAGSMRPFDIELRGIVFSGAAGLIKGYDEGRLTSLRREIREELRKRGLANDERYESESAHVTFVRFTGRLADPHRFSEVIEGHRETGIGGERVAEVELVEHDWYNSRGTKRVIGRLELGACRA